ncbi:MAG: hypothetical protein ACHQFW_04670 [Chitinophagales bacterium]
MKPSDDLFRLIKSLDKNEKGYFKKNAQSGSGVKDKNYLLLFDAIDAQESYNEDALIKKFRGQSFVKQFSVAKNYLWELILKSQRAYRSGSSKFMRLNALMESGEVLFEKGLYEEAMKMWEKAKALAIAFDEKPFILDIETWKRRYYIDLKASEWEENTGPSFNLSFQLIESYHHTLLLQEKYLKIVKFYKTQPFFRSEEIKNEWAHFMEDDILIKEPQDFYGRLYFYYIHNLYALLQNDEESSFGTIKKIVELWDANPELKDAEPVRYIAAVNNYLVTLGKFNRNQEYLDYLDSFKPLELNSISKEAIFFEHWWLWKVSGFKMALDLEAYTKFYADTEADINKFSPYINKVRWMIIQYEIALLHLMNNDYNASLAIMNELIDAKDIDLRKDLQANVRIVYLLLHYDMQNNLLLDSITRSVKRYLLSNDFYYNTERVFIKHFNRLINAADKHERKKIFTDMLNELTIVFDENYTERVAFSNLNILRWINSKILDMPYPEMLKAATSEKK